MDDDLNEALAKTLSGLAAQGRVPRETAPPQRPAVTARMPPNFYTPNLEGHGFPWLNVPKAGCGFIRVAFVTGEIVPLLQHFENGEKWGFYPCLGAGCPRCPDSNRRRYGYADVVSTLFCQPPDAEPYLEYCRFILTLTPYAREEIERLKIKRGNVVDFERTIKKTRRGEGDKHGKVIVSFVRDKAAIEMPRPCNVRSYLTRKLELLGWPDYSAGVKPNFGIVG